MFPAPIGEPLSLDVVAAIPSAAHCVAAGDGLYQATADEPAEFTVALLDLFLNPSTPAPGRSVTAVFRDLAAVTVAVEPFDATTQLLTYTLTDAGEHVLTISLGTEVVSTHVVIVASTLNLAESVTAKLAAVGAAAVAFAGAAAPAIYKLHKKTEASWVTTLGRLGSIATLGLDCVSDIIFATTEAEGDLQTASIASLILAAFVNGFASFMIVRTARDAGLLNERLMTESSKPYAVVSLLSCFGLDALVVSRRTCFIPARRAHSHRRSPLLSFVMTGDAVDLAPPRGLPHHGPRQDELPVAGRGGPAAARHPDHLGARQAVARHLRVDCAHRVLAARQRPQEGAL